MSTFMIRLSLVSTFLVATMASSCGLLAPLLAGMKLGDESDMMMSGNDAAKASLPYQAQPSNKAKVADDAGQLYGFVPSK